MGVEVPVRRAGVIDTPEALVNADLAREVQARRPFGAARRYGGTGTVRACAPSRAPHAPKQPHSRSNGDMSRST